MSGKYMWIICLVVIQISVSLSRSTDKPHDEEKVKASTEKSFWQAEVVKILDASNFTDDLGNPILMQAAVVPSKMFDYPYDPYSSEVLTVYAIIGIVFGVFIFCSLVLGVILLICCKKKPQRGFVINRNTGGQIIGIQNPLYGVQAPATTRATQQYSPIYEQQQAQQNMHPSTCDQQQPQQNMHPPSYAQQTQQNILPTSYDQQQQPQQNMLPPSYEQQQPQQNMLPPSYEQQQPQQNLYPTK